MCVEMERERKHIRMKRERERDYCYVEKAFKAKVHVSLIEWKSQGFISRILYF